MSRQYKNKNISQIYYGGRPIKAVYRGLRLIWQKILSCFSAGYWINDKNWDNESGWKND